jgi:hypothetical protein
MHDAISLIVRQLAVAARAAAGGAAVNGDGDDEVGDEEGVEEEGDEQDDEGLAWDAVIHFLKALVHTQSCLMSARKPGMRGIAKPL